MTDYDASTTTSGDITRFEAFEYQVGGLFCFSRLILCMCVVLTCQFGVGVICSGLVWFYLCQKGVVEYELQ